MTSRVALNHPTTKQTLNSMKDCPHLGKTPMRNQIVVHDVQYMKTVSYESRGVLDLQNFLPIHARLD